MKGMLMPTACIVSTKDTLPLINERIGCRAGLLIIKDINILLTVV